MFDNDNTVHIYRSHHVYYMFGFLFLVFLILVITCSETAILLCYFHLCAEVSTQVHVHVHIREKNCKLELAIL